MLSLSGLRNFFTAPFRSTRGGRNAVNGSSVNGAPEGMSGPTTAPLSMVPVPDLAPETSMKPHSKPVELDVRELSAHARRDADALTKRFERKNRLPGCITISEKAFRETTQALTRLRTAVDNASNQAHPDVQRFAQALKDATVSANDLNVWFGPLSHSGMMAAQCQALASHLESTLAKPIESFNWNNFCASALCDTGIKGNFIPVTIWTHLEQQRRAHCLATRFPGLLQRSQATLRPG